MKTRVSKFNLGLRFNRDNLDDDIDRTLNTSIECENEYNNLQFGGMNLLSDPTILIFGLDPTICLD